MRNYFIGAVVLVILFSSCHPLEIERPGIILHWGMRYDEASAEKEINGNFSKMRELGMQNLVLELPLLADNEGMPRIPSMPMNTFRSLGQKYKIRLHLVFANASEKELFPEGEIPEEIADQWFFRLLNLVDSVLYDFNPYPPVRVVFGGSLKPTERHEIRWGHLLNRLRSKYYYSFSYGANADRANDITYWRYCDEISIDYPPSAGADQRAYCRKHNQAISRLADSLNKPVFVYRGNIMGNDQTFQLKNRLRFWGDSVRVEGVTFNTLYARIPIRDSETYYGLKNDPEVMDFVQEYRRRPH